jgi:6-pyruvoyltetrahydropterin/6-carboxytetrahydropterin synthase
MITLTRRYHFSSSHRLHTAALSDSENVRLYGKCNNPFGHGHDYVLEVTVAGPVDEHTGLLLPIERLDKLAKAVILQRFAHRNMNLDVPEFRELAPTTENMARVIANLLAGSWHILSGSPLERVPRLHRIHLQETDRNGFEVLLGTPEPQSLLVIQPESVTLNA